MDTFRKALLAAALMLAACTAPAAAGMAGTAGPRSLPGTTTSLVTLVWTAPGDDGFEGAAAEYDLRYSLSPITPQNFDEALRVDNVTHPGAAGVRQRAKVTGLEANRLYYFALKAADDAGNWSLLSNVAFKTAPDASALARASEISLSSPFPSPARGRIHVAFTVPEEMFAHIKVFDVSGRERKTLAYDTYAAGTTTLLWDLDDENGVRLGIGQYWIKALIGNRTLTQRLTIIP